MPRLTNAENLPLSIAVWLAGDDYDAHPDPRAISVTSLIKPVKQVILTKRVATTQGQSADVVSLVNSRMGTAFHNSIETTWLNSHKECLESLGYPKKVIERVRINPDPATVTEDDIPIYMELRRDKQIDGFIITGKFDFVGDGRLEDFKSTGVYTWIKKTNDEKYQLQGSLYRWLNQDIITRDSMAIQFIFTDWSKLNSLREKNYPPKRIMEYPIPLMPISETEAYIKRKLAELKKYWDKPEEDMPPCSREDLWQDDPIWKYYKGGVQTNRSTKNFDSLVEANQRRIDDGGTGLVVEVPGKAKACNYCNAAPMCKQRQELIAVGLLDPA